MTERKLRLAPIPVIQNPSLRLRFPQLVHRWDFGDGDGTNVTDLISGADGEVKGDGFMWEPGKLVLEGGDQNDAAYVDLPNGLLSSQGQENGGSGGITFEGWVKVFDTPNWGRIFDFGDNNPGGDEGELEGPGRRQWRKYRGDGLFHSFGHTWNQP